MEVINSNFKSEISEIHKAFAKPVARGYSISETKKFFYENKIIAEVVPGSSDQIVSFYMPEYKIRGYINFIKNPFYQVNNMLDSGKKEFIIPEYILIKVDKEQHNIWKDYLRKNRRYDIQDGSSFFATNMGLYITLSFYKYLLKGNFVIIGEPNFKASSVKI